MPPLSPAEASAASSTLQRLHTAICRTIRGKDEVVQHVLTCLLAGGHVLLEDAPGVGKTTLAYALARAVDCSFSRIQFTSDLLPSDVTGVSLYNESTRAFEFRPGPVFAHIVLADEINRATPKTQSALLEVMDRARVTLDGQTHAVGSPFLVFATQNPVDYEGTFPLPESQLDRFLLRLHMGYPSYEYELEILRSSRTGYDAIDVEPVVHGDEIVALQKAATRVYLEESVADYLLRLVDATRREPSFRTGVSVRGGISLRQAAQARALLLGRPCVLPEDIAALAEAAFIHRISARRLSQDPGDERGTVAARLRQLLAEVPAPR
ncbi:AAA family ATPase [Nibricoccus sp. IMCC34717]|uniref:AAA family ATPase n=1 Tax=Nibricoccus sp. IMCC34717 TaxID=3034021 RepID=UPI00384C3232